ncbi:MAG: DNA polymerase III subunit delta [Lachnospiraceae bacterium]|nr:DNA polymerase III subunit delta [Lachnospiraceae bacterium]
MKRIAEDIKSGEFNKLYLLFGEEAYLRKLYLSRLLTALGAEEGDMNFTRFSGRNTKEDDIISICDTMPFFAERRVVLVDGAELFKEKHEKLTEYLKELPDFVTLILNEESADKRSRLYKEIAKNGCAAEFVPLDEKGLSDWVLRRLGKDHKKIRKSTLERFLSTAGNDLSYINNEVDKLVSYTEGREEITAEDIQAVCSPVIENKIFELVSATAEGDRKKALEKYDDLLVLKEPPMRILYLIAKQFDRLMNIRELQEKGLGQAAIADQLKIKPYAVKMSMPAVRRYSLAELREAVEEMVRYETDVKTGMLDERLSVELIILKYSGTKKDFVR